MDDKAWFVQAIALLGDSLEAWEGEEDSVQKRHADLIADLNTFFEAFLKQAVRGTGH